jgi:transposase
MIGKPSSPVRREAARKRTSPTLAPRCAADPPSWLLRFKRLGLRYDRTERTTLALLTLACTVINVRRLIKIELCDQV